MRHAIVGCGGIAPMHAESILKIEGSELVVCCDVVEERAKGFEDKYGGKTMTSYEAVLERDDIDMIHACTPSGMHADQAMAALRAGKNVITEKPVDVTVAKCRELIEVAEQSTAQATCIFQNRFLADCRAVRDAVEQGLLGKLNMGDAYIKWFRTQGYYDSGDWRATWALDGGGCMMNQGVHYVDLLQWYMGPVQSVHAICDTMAHDIEVEDVAAAVVRFKSGAIGVIEGSTAAAPGLDWRIELHGDQGSIVLKNGKIDQWRFLDKAIDQKPPQPEQPSEESAAGADPRKLPFRAHLDQIKATVDAINNGEQVPIPVQEARNAVEIINAMYESSRRGETVTLPLEA